MEINDMQILIQYLVVHGWGQAYTLFGLYVIHHLVYTSSIVSSNFSDLWIAKRQWVQQTLRNENFFRANNSC